jgi:SAM-dependent methyltransferase/superfamily II DNA or RNA helicase
MDRRGEFRENQSELDAKILYTDNKTGEHITFGKFAQVFKGTPVDKQARRAFYCVEQYNVDANYVAKWITDDATKNQFRVWCIGRGIEIEEDKKGDSTNQRATTDTLLSQDQALIDALSPLMTVRDLAELRIRQQYRDASDEELQYLIGGSYRLLGEYLGHRRAYKRGHERPTLLPLPELPIEIFQDNLTSNILFESQRVNLLEVFNQSAEACFNQIKSMKALANDPLHLAFIQRLDDHFREVDAQEFPMFNQLIAGSLKDIPQEEVVYSPFPSNHQKEYAYNFVRKWGIGSEKIPDMGMVDLLVGDTATQKTGAAICAMEKAGTKGTLVICPPGIPRGDWVKEIKEKYKDPVEIAELAGLSDLRKYLSQVQDAQTRFIVLGYTLLSSIDRAPDRDKLIADLVQKTGRDSLIYDESHLSKELAAQCTRVLFDISKTLPEAAPRIGMTATAVVNTVEDLDAQVRILLPYRYSEPGDFTRAARNEPYLVSYILRGKKLMTRWSKHSILKGKLPSVEYHDIAVPFSPFQHSLYHFVHEDDSREGVTKRTMLRQVSLDPLLVKRYYSPSGINKEITRLEQRLETKQEDRDRQNLEAMIDGLKDRVRRVSSLYDLESAQRTLLEAHDQYQHWVVTQNPEETFDEDFLVRLGFDDLAIWAFFNLPSSVDSLVGQSKNLSLMQDWKGKEGLFSSKYRRLKQDLDAYAAAGDTKALIFSGFYKTGVTSGIEDLEEVDEDNFLSLYDQLRIWYGDEHVAKIDGTVTAEPKNGEDSQREKIRKMFRLNPNLWFLLLTSRSSRLGINLTIPPTQANEGIKKVVQKHLDEPDTYADKNQEVGRSERPGQVIPIEVDTYRATSSEYPRTLRYGFIDQGIAEALDFKRLISQMVLDGIPLTMEEERFVREHLIGVKVQELYPVTPRQYLIDSFYTRTRGAGYKRNREFLRSIGFEGMTNAEFYASNYILTEEKGIAGHSAKVTTEIIRRYKQSIGKDDLRIGSIGAGTGILQSLLGGSVVNVDMMEEMLQVGRGRLQDQGGFTAGDIANIPILSESFDVIDASLVIHWTDSRSVVRRDGRLVSERALAVAELNRVTKPGGLITMSIPHSYLNNDSFSNLTSNLENYFGFKLIEEIPSGLVRATDFRNEPISWILNLEKVGGVQSGFESSSLKLDFDDPFVNISTDNRRGRDRIIGINLPIPHDEFEIIGPDGGKDAITFIDINAGDELEKDLKRTEQEFRTGTDVLAKIGSEEYGMQRRLARAAMRKWNLSTQEAESLSLDAIDTWSREGMEKHNAKSIWAELQEIMIELQERSN